ncbi:tyrosine-type recombinase/integrase [Streptomyces sp.]|uniref:tyrosine-type recombinase/integrase n=1 Tax=Streptomyces sp. TaxID=1931 RepID=UPI002F3E4CA1
MIASAACGCEFCKGKIPTPERPAEKDHSGSWQARYTGLDGREHHKNKPTYDEAVALLEEMRTAVRQRTWLDPARGEITLCAWHEIWWPVQVGEEATLDRDERMWRTHVAPAFGSHRLYELGYMEIQAWVNRLHDGNGGPLAAGSVIKAFQILDRMLTSARLDRRIPFNPAEGVKLPTVKKAHPEDRRPPTYVQLWRIRAHVPDYHHAFLIVAQETGLRFGELAGLRACWVDLDRRRLQVREVLTEVRGVVRRKAYPKSNAGLRTVPLTGLACRVLAELLADEKPSTARTDPKEGLHPEELVFHGRNRRGRDGQPARAPMRRSGWRRIWTRAIEDAGVVRKTTKEWIEEEKDVATGRTRKVERSRTFWWPEFHDVRHAYASRLHDRGVPEAITQELLGHERAGEVTWLYTHAAADYAGQALAALEDGTIVGRRRARLRLVAA